MNNLDPDVAERPDDLVVYGGTGRAARSWEAFDAIVAALRALEDDETLLVQSGKPVGVFRTHAGAPRVLIANTNLVGRWATWDVFRELERHGLIMYGQMTAGSWIYIGSQGIVQGTYETFGAMARAALRRHARRALRAHRRTRRDGRRPAARRHDVRRGDPRHRGGRGAHRQAAGNRATAIARRRSLDEALAWIGEATRQPQGALGRPGRQCGGGASRNWCAAGSSPMSLTDQTSAHDTLQRLRAGRASRSPRRRRCGTRDPERVRAVARPRRSVRARARDAGAAAARRGDVRLRQQHPHRRARRRRGATPSTFRGSSRSTSARSSAKARGRSAGSRSPAIRGTSTAPTSSISNSFPRTSTCALDHAGAGEDALPGTAGPHLLAGAGRRARSSASRSTNWSRRASSRRPS